MVTIYDIAAKAGVSAMTVSRVINNTGKISDKTRAKVRRVMEELNYVPNQMARSLVLQQSNLLFLLITDITNPFYTTLARGAEDAARKYGYRLLFGNSDESLEKEKDYMDTILTTRVDGVLVAPAGDPSLPHLETLRKHQGAVRAARSGGAGDGKRRCARRQQRGRAEVGRHCVLRTSPDRVDQRLLLTFPARACGWRVIGRL